MRGSVASCLAIMKLPSLALTCVLPLALHAAEPLNIGSRWELFVDEYLVAKKSGVALKLAEPVRREVVLTTDQPWEGQTCAYFSAIQDGSKLRLY